MIQLVIDLSKVETVTGFRYLPRAEKNYPGFRTYFLYLVQPEQTFITGIDSRSEVHIQQYHFRHFFQFMKTDWKKWYFVT